jgi:peptidyl-prolyl cis-trans isomerase D
MSALFGARDKGTPDKVHVPQGYVVYQVTKVEAARAPSFDEIRTRVEQEYKSDKAQQMLQQKTTDLAEKAKSLHDLKKAAKEMGAEVKTSDLVGTTSQVPDIGALSGPAQVVFEMKPGDISGPISTGRGGAVVMLMEKQEPPAAQFAASKDRLREQLLQKKRNEFLEVFAANLQKQMEKSGKIKINQQEMKRITTPSQGTESGF